MPKPLTKEERELGRKFRRVLREEEVALLHFKEADRLTEELLKEIHEPLTCRVPLNRKRKEFYGFKNNFEKSNTAFRAKSFKRLEPTKFKVI